MLPREINHLQNAEDTMCANPMSLEVHSYGSQLRPSPALAVVGEGTPWVSVQGMDGASLPDRGGKEDGGATFRMGRFVHGAAQLPPHPFLLLPLPRR